ncbi:MAG: hypothetical protein HC819_08660 [Cyclobacteriaceae bacterium]|nr:hypothetical protein [Cyclobacteriaceae bacterium]
MRNLLILAIFASMLACEPRQGKSVDDTPPSANSTPSFVAQEVLQANSYTYVKGLEGDKTFWMAIPTQEVQVGETYYYIPGMEMKNFHSKDLDRDFESVYFLNGISDKPAVANEIDGQGAMPNDENHTLKESPQKEEVNIQAEKGVTTIGSLYSNRGDFENKKIKVKGVVTKYNPDIMQKNWVHLQDGTGDEQGFDLTITTLDRVEVGSIATFEGVLVLNKDFGHGYKYDLLLENASLISNDQEVKVN